MLLYFDYRHLPMPSNVERSDIMYDEISLEQRTHDLAVAATILYYQQQNIEINESNAFEYGMKYRSLLNQIRKSMDEGKSDLR